MYYVVILTFWQPLRELEHAHLQGSTNQAYIFFAANPTERSLKSLNLYRDFY